MFIYLFFSRYGLRIIFGSISFFIFVVRFMRRLSLFLQIELQCLREVVFGRQRLVFRRCGWGFNSICYSFRFFFGGKGISKCYVGDLSFCMLFVWFRFICSQVFGVEVSFRSLGQVKFVQKFSLIFRSLQFIIF